MNKKGITLVELIAVLAIIALLATIALINVSKIIRNSNKEANVVQESSIRESAESYLMDHIGDEIDFDTTSSVTITLKDLVDGGYVLNNPKNPKTGKEYNLSASTITITKDEATYNYNLNLK